MNPPQAFDWESQIQELQGLTQSMLQLAQSGEWERVAVLEEQRRLLIERLFQIPPPESCIPLLQNAVQLALVSDARVQELARAERDRLGEKLRALRIGRRALNAYDHGP